MEKSENIPFKLMGWNGNFIYTHTLHFEYILNYIQQLTYV